ncbi:MAG: glycosyltransferase family 9 protein [Ignavibacteriales bacterium]|nr:glycosyltransferase family 9 protein [Ignavibacteriales bacterium]
MTLPNKTVVFRLSSIGDIVLSSALLRVMRQSAGKDARIDFVVRKEYAELVRSSHHLSIVHEYDVDSGFDGLKKLAKELYDEHYDLAVDIHDSIRTKFLRTTCRPKETVVIDKRKFERWLLVNMKRNAYDDELSVAERYIETVEKYGVKNDGKGLEIFIPDSILFDVSGKMGRLKLNRFEKVVGICPGAKHFTKRWQKEKFAEVAVRTANEFHAKIHLFGGADERADCAFVADEVSRGVSPDAVTNFAGEFSILETTAALEFCDVVITNDSGLMHLAAAKQKKIVAIFGSTVNEFGFYPYGTESIVIERKDLECRPCTHIGRKSCPKEHFKCLVDISADEVFEATKKMIQ